MLTTTLCDFDNAAHARAYLDLLAHYMEDPMGDTPRHDEAAEEELIDTLAAMPHAFAVLAQENGTYVGMATCFVTYSTFAVAPVVNIHDIVVHADYRGRGIGRTLLRAVADIARDLGCAKVTLEVRTDNPAAQALYRSEGFADCTPPMMFWVKVLTLSTSPYCRPFSS